MVTLRLGVVFVLAISKFVSGSPAKKHRKRSTVSSDKIVGLAQSVPVGAVGNVYLTYQPYLYVVNGCVPFPGVDAVGNTNAGLKPTGSSNGDCSSNEGQIYVRGASYGSYYALMYSWYMPKDEPSTGIGHRHDWEGVVIWLSTNASTTESNIVAVCPSEHGGWDCSTDSFTLSGTKPLVKYESYWPLDHACFLTTTTGGTQPLVSWENLPTAARSALDTTDFGSANVPFNENNFQNNLAKATF